MITMAPVIHIMIRIIHQESTDFITQAHGARTTTHTTIAAGILISAGALMVVLAGDMLHLTGVFIQVGALALDLGLAGIAGATTTGAGITTTAV